MSRPFARAIAMFALISAAMGDSMKLAAIGPYKSRGHGRGTPGRNYLRNWTPPRRHTEEQAALRRRLGGFKGDKAKQLEVYYGR